MEGKKHFFMYPARLPFRNKDGKLKIVTRSKKRRRGHGSKGDADVQLPVAPSPEYSRFYPDHIKSMGGNDTNPGTEQDHHVDLVGGVLYSCEPEFFLDSNFVDMMIDAQNSILRML